MDNLLKEEISVKSFTIKNNNDSSLSLYNNFDNNTTNQQSKDNQNLNEKIIKLFIGNHPLISMKTIKKISHFNFINKYLKNEFYYNSIIIDHIIHNDPGHIVAEFKDFLIMGDINEFLQNYYNEKESKYLLPKIYEYYISCSVIFPNYVILPESQYIYKNIQKKQRVIDVQQEQEDKEENIKKGLIKQEKEEDLFSSQVLDSILNQTDTSGIKQYFGISTDGNSLGGGQLSKIIEGISFYEKNKISQLKPKINNCLYKNNNKIDLDDSFFKNKKKEEKKNVIKIKEGNIPKKEKENNIKNNKVKKNNNKIIHNKKINYPLNKDNIQLSNSIKIINEISLNNMNNDNNISNGISLKNIISRNKHYNKSKQKESQKDNNNKGRNCLRNLEQENNNFYTTTNNNGGFSNILTNTLNSKCNTSRHRYDKEKIKDIIINNENKINKSNKNNRNINNSLTKVCNPKSLNIIKKSLINSLLNSKQDIEIKNKVNKSNSRIILNSNIKEKNKTSMNALIFESITKNSLNNSKNKYKKEMISTKNINDKNNNESEYIFIKNKHNNHLFSGLENDKKIIYRRKKNKDIYSYYNKNKLSTNSSIKNIRFESKTKNYSSNNILGFNHKKNLSSSNISYSFKNKNKIKQKKMNKKKDNKHLNDTNGNISNKKNTILNINDDKIKELQRKQNKFENQNEEYFSSYEIKKENKKTNFIEKIDIKKSKPSKEIKLIENHNELNGINSYKHKSKNYNSNNINMNKNIKNPEKIINLDKRMEKEISEKILRGACLLNSPNNSLSNKNILIKSELREIIKNEELGRPLTVRESLNRNDANTEVIQILTNKINTIKQFMKESDKKNINSISQIFKKKKIDRKNIIIKQNSKNNEKNNKPLLSDRKKNKIKLNKINNTVNNNEIASENRVKNIYINNNFNNNKKDNNVITKKKKRNYEYINHNNGFINNQNNETKIKHFRYKSNFNINNGINYLSETNYNINFKLNQNKTKELNKNNKINSNGNINYINNNEEEKEKEKEKEKKNILMLNNDIKSCSLKVLPIKQISQNKIIVKGIKINGFEKIVSKKYTTRNIDIPQYVTDRLKKINGGSGINNSNRYINTSNSHKTKIIPNKINGKNN